MKRYKKSYYKLLQETVDYYSKDTERRGINEEYDEDGNGTASRCVYLSPTTGNMCAVGRCMTEAHLQKASTLNQTVNGLVNVLDVEDADGFLQPKYKGYKIAFWSALQRLHDGSKNWDSKGITNEGLDLVRRIKSEINNEKFV